MEQPRGRPEVEDALLDATERLLIEVGYAGVTTRGVAQEAGVNHGLVHYYFGSMEELLLRVLERFTDRLIERQTAMYASDRPFIDRWRQAMRYLTEDRRSGYQKIWLELQAMAWNHPEFRERVAAVTRRWRTVLTDAIGRALKDYALPARRYPVEAVVALVVTCNEGMILERHMGVDDGHTALLRWIERLLVSLEEEVRR